MGQTLKDIEVICINDGATDSSPGILSDYADRDSRIKVFSQPNSGPGPARNAGLDSASDEAVVFMDPDDKYPDSGVLEDLWVALSAADCPVVGGKARCFPEDDPAVARRNEVSDRVCAFPHFGVVDYSEYQVPYRYWCYMFRRSLLDGVRFPDLRSFQDVPFFVKAMAKAERFLAVNRLVYCYRQHEGNGTKNLTKQKIRDRFTGIAMTMGTAARNGYWRMFDAEARRVRKMANKHGIGRWSLAWRMGAVVSAVMVFRILMRKAKSTAATEEVSNEQ